MKRYHVHVGAHAIPVKDTPAEVAGKVNQAARLGHLMITLTKISGEPLGVAINTVTRID